MSRLLLSSEQRFTCAQCGRCCHRTTVPITIEEAGALRKAGAAHWFDEGDSTKADLSRRSADLSRRSAVSAEAEGAKAAPFEAIAGHTPLLRIRKRSDGA